MSAKSRQPSAPNADAVVLREVAARWGVETEGGRAGVRRWWDGLPPRARQAFRRTYSEGKLGQALDGLLRGMRARDVDQILTGAAWGLAATGEALGASVQPLSGAPSAGAILEHPGASSVPEPVWPGGDVGEHPSHEAG